MVGYNHCWSGTATVAQIQSLLIKVVVLFSMDCTLQWLEDSCTPSLEPFPNSTSPPQLFFHFSPTPTPTTRAMGQSHQQYCSASCPGLLSSFAESYTWVSTHSLDLDKTLDASWYSRIPGRFRVNPSGSRIHIGGSHHHSIGTSQEPARAEVQRGILHGGLDQGRSAHHGSQTLRCGSGSVLLHNAAIAQGKYVFSLLYTNAKK